MKVASFSLLLRFSIAAVIGAQSLLSSSKHPKNAEYNDYHGAEDGQSDLHGFSSAKGSVISQKDVFKSTSDDVPLSNHALVKAEDFTTEVTKATLSSRQWSKRSAEDEQFTNSTIVQMPPVTIALALSNISDPLEFLEKFALPDAPSAAVKSDDKESNTAEPKSALLERTIGYPFAQSASCSPQPTTVPITFGSDPFDIYFPSCTRIDRCGGCCSHDLLQCAPLSTETVTYQVIKTRYLGPPINKFDVSETVLIELEKHLDCQCQCRFHQIYRPNECRCECINQHEIRYCVGDKIWDPNACICRCREIYECSTGFAFNLDTCKCEAKRVIRMGFGPAFRGLDETTEE